MTATTPTLKVEIAFASDPFDTPVWTDVTDWVEAVNVSRGKASVLTDMQAGTCTVTLDNTDGRFDPNHTAGAYAPNVKPFRRLRVTAGTDLYTDVYTDTYSGGSAGLFAGFITAWPQAYEWPEVATVTVQAVDGFQILNLRKLSGSYVEQLSSARVSAILDDIGWPAGDRSIDTGQTTVQASTLDGDNPLAHLQTVARTENGLLFIDRDGNLRFRSRHGLIGGAWDDAAYTFGDVAGDIAFAGVVVNYDDQDIWNDVRVASDGVAEQTASDAGSQAAYLTRTLSRSGLLLTTVVEQEKYARYLLVGFAEPALRVDSLVHDQVLTADEWASVLSRDLGDKVRVRYSPPGGGQIVQRSFVEGIRWQVVATPDGDRWQCSWSLTPATRRVDFWLAGDPVQSLAGVTTRGAY